MAEATAIRHLRDCPLDPPPEIEIAADLLGAAADAALAGEPERAAALLQQANIASLWAYADLAMNGPKSVKKSVTASYLDRQSPNVGMPSLTIQRSIFRRDGYRCRYCGCRVVHKEARSVLTSHFPEAAPWPGGKGGDKLKHGAFYAINSVIDHVVPRSQGGDNSPENLVTACWPCNFHKEDYSLDDLGLSDPRLRPPVVDDWDGLERLVSLGRMTTNRAQVVRGETPPRLTKTLKTASANSKAATLEDWLAVFGRQSRDLADRLGAFLRSLETDQVRLSIHKQIMINLRLGENEMAILGISHEGDVDVPFLLNGQKSRFKGFATALAQAIPGAQLYETQTMWRVDGGGTAKGQITVAELLEAADIVRSEIGKIIASAGPI